MYFTPDWDAARRSVKQLAEYAPVAAITGHGPPLRGERLQDGLHELSSHFDVWARPARGRYRDHPAITDGSGVVDVPPPQISTGTVLLAGVALGAVLALATTIRRRDEDGDDDVLLLTDGSATSGHTSESITSGAEADMVPAQDVSMRARELSDATSQIDAGSGW